MEFVLGWIVLSIAVGAVAARKDRSGFGWFLLAIVISPLIAIVFLIAAGEGNVTRCPLCAERVKAKAQICPHCHSELQSPGEIIIEGRAPPRSRWRG